MSDLDSSMNNLRDVAESTNARLERQSDKNKEKMEKERAEQRAKLERKEDKQFALISILLATMFIVEPLSQVIANVLLKKEIEWNEKTIAALSWFIISLMAVLIFSYIIFKKKNDTATNNNTNTNNNGTATNNTNTNTNNNGTTNNTTIN